MIDMVTEPVITREKDKKEVPVKLVHELVTELKASGFVVNNGLDKLRSIAIFLVRTETRRSDVILLR